MHRSIHLRGVRSSGKGTFAFVPSKSIQGSFLPFTTETAPSCATVPQLVPDAARHVPHPVRQPWCSRISSMRGSGCSRDSRSTVHTSCSMGSAAWAAAAVAKGGDNPALGGEAASTLKNDKVDAPEGRSQWPHSTGGTKALREVNSRRRAPSSRHGGSTVDIRHSGSSERSA